MQNVNNDNSHSNGFFKLCNLFAETGRERINSYIEKLFYKKAFSLPRIIINEMIREAIEPYLNDLQYLDWENVTPSELNEIIIESIICHNKLSQFSFSWSKDTPDFHKHFYDWQETGKRQAKYVKGKKKELDFIGKNIGGFIPLCIQSVHLSGQETHYYCRHISTKKLVKIKISDLHRLKRGEIVSGLSATEVDPDYVVG